MQMTFKQFLAESRSKEIDPEEAISIINRDCTEYAKKMADPRFNIYRGGSGGGELDTMLADSHSGEARKSANTRNYFTLWHDNRPEWAAFPKRSRSFICSSSEATADAYGPVSVLIPFDGSKIGVLPADDLFDSFPKLGMQINELNDYIELALDAEPTFFPHDIRAPSTYQALVEALEHITPILLDVIYDVQDEIYKELNRLMKQTNSKNLLGVFETILVPDKSFKHYTTRTAEPLKDDKELYVEGKVVMLPWHRLRKPDDIFQVLIDKFNWKF